jgi:serine/threonine-protein kinase HipA
MMRAAAVYYDEVLAGYLKETADGEYTFQYDKNYIVNHPDQFITFSMPVNDHIYHDKRLFAFFEGLIPEGWLLDIASKNWKIDPNDRMGLLMVCCQNCIGAVSVKPVSNEREDE